MEKNKTYEVEDLLEMLGGDKYYSMDNIMYVYHSLKGEHEEASFYLKVLEREKRSLDRELKKLSEQNLFTIKNDNYYKPLADESNSSSCGFDESKGSDDVSSTVVTSER